MTNKQGDFIWYELMTREPDTAIDFYGALLGWRISKLPGEGDYYQIAAGDTPVGGIFPLSEVMCEQGARPAWLGYVAVDDVDSSAAKVQQLGGQVLMPAKDIPGVGRIAMIADPQGAPLYIMRGSMEGASEAFSHSAMGHCAWNELSARDQQAAFDFFGELFGWQNKENMSMGDMGEYRFIHHHEDMIGAVSPQMQEGPTAGWTYYFHVRDIDAAVEITRAQGGQLQHGPHEIPGGEYIIIGSDPEGTHFALVGARKS